MHCIVFLHECVGMTALTPASLTLFIQSRKEKQHAGFLLLSYVIPPVAAAPVPDHFPPAG